MTKAELLAALQLKFYLVEQEQDISSQPELDAGFNHFLVGVWQTSANDGIVRRNINFYVYDLGGPGETAYWQGGDPVPAPAASFSSEVQAYISAKIADGSIEAGFIQSVNEVDEKATVDGWIDVAGTLEQKTVLVDRDGVGDLRHRILGGAAAKASMLSRVASVFKRG